MKHFFYILFGGLIAMFIGIGISYGGAFILGKAVSSLSVPNASAEDGMSPLDQMAVSGLARKVTYTADQEEGLINEAASALPSNSSKGMSAKAYVVIDTTTGQTIVSNNADQLLPIASLTKLVTAVVARKLVPGTTRITLTKQMMSTYGNTADFKAGETFSASDLLYPLLLVSSNDAAEAYAQSYGRAKFVQAMNDFTQSIGAYRTYFADPSGLDPKNVSTADDLVRIITWIRINDPEIIQTTMLHAKTVRSHTWINPTHFLSWSYYVGGKNGYLPEADRTAVSLFAIGPRKDIYAIVVLGSDNRDSDVIKLLQKAQQ